MIKAKSLYREYMMKCGNRAISFLSGAVLFSLLVASVPLRAEPMTNARYAYSFKTNRSACMARINNVPLLDNFSAGSGMTTAGGDITSFSANGKNMLELVMGAIDPDNPETLYKESWCEIVVTKETRNASEAVSTIRLTVDSEKKVVASSSSHPDGAENESAVSEVQSPGDKINGLVGAGRQITVSDIPTWAWEQARPVTPQDMSAIKTAYTTIWQAMNNKEVAVLKSLAQISTKEFGIATGFPPDFIFETLGLAEKVQDADLTMAPLDWEGKELITYCDGRIFRLAAGVYQNSPLKMKNKAGKIKFTYNPYFAIIDGNVVIAR
ncbi:hypothetical protein PYR66_22030 [Klebsiella aerogenes]|nr:hypothetical protein PYR66_22030 [Klebsiella aerogenes]